MRGPLCVLFVGQAFALAAVPGGRRAGAIREAELREAQEPARATRAGSETFGTAGVAVPSFGVELQHEPDAAPGAGSALERDAGHRRAEKTYRSAAEEALRKALHTAEERLQEVEEARQKLAQELAVAKLLVKPTEHAGENATTHALPSLDLAVADAADEEDPLVSAGVHGQSYVKDWVFYGAPVGQCVGNWSKWSSCMAQCYQLRKFYHVCTREIAVPPGASLRLDTDGVTVQAMSDGLPKALQVGASRVTAYTLPGSKRAELRRLEAGQPVPEIDLSAGAKIEITPVMCDDTCSSDYYMPQHGQLDYRQCKVGACKGMGELRAPDKTSLIFPIETQHIYNAKVFITNLAQPISIFWVFNILAVGWVAKFEWPWMPDAGVIYILCITVAMIAKFSIFGGLDYGMWMDEILSFLVEPTLYLLLLPISIFEGGYNIQRKNFYSQFGYGCAFAIVGTVASAFGLAALIVLTGSRYANWHEISTWREALVYAAFIADLDPVATLAAFSKLKVDPLLSTLVGGEATLNDPVAIIMFGILNSKDFDPDEGNPGKAIGEGLLLLALSMVMGIAIGMFFTFLQKIANIRGDTTAEALFTVMSAYALFAAGELSKQSGIIVCLFGGLVMGIYSRDNIEAEHQDLVCNALGIFARLADSGIFMIVGLCVFTMGSFSYDAQLGGFYFGLLTMLFCLIVRAVVTALLVPPMNLVKAAYGDAGNKISFGTAVMIWHSQQRGGLTLMMALMIDPSWCHTAPTLVDATITVCVGFCFLIGFTCPMMLKLCGVPMGADQTDGTLGVQERNLGRLEQLSQLLRTVLCYADASDHCAAIQAGGRAQQQARATWRKVHTTVHGVKLAHGSAELAKEHPEQ